MNEALTRREVLFGTAIGAVVVATGGAQVIQPGASATVATTVTPFLTTAADHAPYAVSSEVWTRYAALASQELGDDRRAELRASMSDEQWIARLEFRFDQAIRLVRDVIDEAGKKHDEVRALKCRLEEATGGRRLLKNGSV